MKLKTMRLVAVAALATAAACTEPTTRADAGASAAAGRARATENAVAARDTLTETEAFGVARGGANVRHVPPPELFDKAFRDASARRHAPEIAALSQAFLDLGPGVDPAEAARAARVVYTYVDQLVEEYEIEDSPTVHNTKVNFGQKPRGLCWHWAHDLDIRLQMERFETLQIHRAIANYNNLRLEHSTTLLGRRGGRMENAIVLDPWRNGGELFWKIAHEDTRYDWTPRDEVFAFKRQRQARRERENADRRVVSRRD